MTQSYLNGDLPKVTVLSSGDSISSAFSTCSLWFCFRFCKISQRQLTPEFLGLGFRILECPQKFGPAGRWILSIESSRNSWPVSWWCVAKPSAASLGFVMGPTVFPLFPCFFPCMDFLECFQDISLLSHSWFNTDGSSLNVASSLSPWL